VGCCGCTMWHGTYDAAKRQTAMWHTGGVHLSDVLHHGVAYLLTWTNGRVPRGIAVLRWPNQVLPHGISCWRWLLGCRLIQVSKLYLESVLSLSCTREILIKSQPLINSFNLFYLLCFIQFYPEMLSFQDSALTLPSQVRVHPLVFSC
jgi:hypothetical protein